MLYEAQGKSPSGEGINQLTTIVHSFIQHFLFLVLKYTGVHELYVMILKNGYKSNTQVV